ncbi:hypothetical protein HGA91_03175 [candidate division WWE3 bacterium]|nr:hypothetical protein [candidate division WWE3 bacterium]
MNMPPLTAVIIPPRLRHDILPTFPHLGSLSVELTMRLGNDREATSQQIGTKLPDLLEGHAHGADILDLGMAITNRPKFGPPPIANVRNDLTRSCEANLGNSVIELFEHV